MQSRRDQVDAQSHLISRLTSALVRGEPDALEPPTRRDTRALASGVLVALIALAAVAGWALFSTRGSTKWQQPGTLILDKATGSRYLLVDETLRPVLNIASARLLAGSSLKTAAVPTSRLAKIPRGAPIGVPDGPDSLPQAALVSHGVWSACALPTPTASGTATASGVLVDIGSAPSTDPVGADEGVLVKAVGQEWLLWRGMKLKVGADWVPDVLGFGSIEPTPVSRAWLDLVPTGTDLAPMAAADAGRAAPGVGGQTTTVGQLFQSQVGRAHFMMMKDGLAPLTATQYALAAAAPGRPAERTLDPAALAAAGHGTIPAGAGRLPVEPPVVRSPAAGDAPCLEYRPTGAAASLDAARLVRRTIGTVPAAIPAAAGSSAGSAALSSDAATGGSGDSGDSANSGSGGMVSGLGGDSGSGAVVSGDASSGTGSPSAGSGGGAAPSAGGAEGGGSTTSPNDVRSVAMVRVTPGGGAVVVTRPGVAVRDQPSVLVDDTGTAYPLAGDALTALGYQPDQAVLIPAPWLALLPPGPLLSKG